MENLLKLIFSVEKKKHSHGKHPNIWICVTAQSHAEFTSALPSDTVASPTSRCSKTRPSRLEILSFDTGVIQPNV